MYINISDRIIFIYFIFGNFTLNYDDGVDNTHINALRLIKFFKFYAIEWLI